MKSIHPFTGQVLVLILGGLLASGQLLAAENDKNKNQSEQSELRKAAMQDHFDDNRKALVRNYFSAEKRNTRCPPGLAKKNNGCNPPGQVKRWEMGQQLQSDVNYSVLPADLSTILGQPQTGFHYGMVDSDILLLMDGTEMVIDAISSFLRLPGGLIFLSLARRWQ